MIILLGRYSIPRGKPHISLGEGVAGGQRGGEGTEF